jgi:hypothetical protein
MIAAEMFHVAETLDHEASHLSDHAEVRNIFNHIDVVLHR